MIETPTELIETPEAADLRRMSVLSAQSKRDDVLLIEVLFHDRWVRFDLSLLEAKHVAAMTLFERYFGKALSAVGIARDPAADLSASSTSVSQE